jgi:hypothetical protein
MTKEETLRSVEQEFATARHAAAEGKDGMSRVCARRAAGVAIAYWLQFNDRPNWRADAMSRIRHLEADPSFPLDVREAAMRLMARITPQFTPQYPTDPIEDSGVIVRHLLR